MKSPTLSERILLIGLLFLFVLLVVHVSSKAQENTRKVPVAPPPQVPVKVPRPITPAAVRPNPRPVPTRIQPQVLRQTPPPRNVQPTVAAKPTGVQGAQSATQLYPGRGGQYPPGRPIGGVSPAGTIGSGGANSAGFRVPPNARSVAMPGGGTMVAHPDGRRWVVDKNNQVTAFSRPGMLAKFNGDGKLSTVQVNRPRLGNMTVTRTSDGERQTVGVRPGGALVVTYGKNRGFVQRLLPGRNGYVQRTYLAGGQPYAHVYRVDRYRSMVYCRYVPAYTYQPRFYAWASNSWPRNATYDWGGSSAPWMGFYGGYFAPAPAYPTASLWLTDFVMGENLKVAYQNHQESDQLKASNPPPAEANSESVPVSPEVKSSISQEVQQVIGEEQADSTRPGGVPPAANVQTPPPALVPNQRTFVVTQNIDVSQAGQACALTPGDVVYRTGDNLVGGNNVPVNVLSSKAGDCVANSSGNIDANTLQEMYNQFREQIDAGLSKLAQNEGKGGLPSGPAADPRPSPVGTAQPEPDVGATLAQDQTDADAAEEIATDGANGGSA